MRRRAYARIPGFSRGSSGGPRSSFSAPPSGRTTNEAPQRIAAVTKCPPRRSDFSISTSFTRRCSMFDPNTTTLALRSRTARFAGLTMAGLVVAALSFFVASAASAGHRYHAQDHHVDCRGHAHHPIAQHHVYRHHYQGHHHRRHSGWSAALHLGLLLPHFQIHFDQPHRGHRRHHDRHNVRERRHRGHDRHARRDRRS